MFNEWDLPTWERKEVLYAHGRVRLAILTKGERVLTFFYALEGESDTLPAARRHYLEAYEYRVSGKLHSADEETPARCTWHPNGKLWVRTYWNHGVLTSDLNPAYIFHNENGSLREEQVWQDGKLIRIKEKE